MSTQTTSRKASEPSKATITSVIFAARSCFCFSVKTPSMTLTVTSGMTCPPRAVIPTDAGAGRGLPVPEASALDERTGIYGIPSRHHGIAPEVHGLFTGQSQFYCGERATKRGW